MSFKKPLLPTSQLIKLFSPSSKRRSSVLSRVPRIPVSRNNVLDRLNERTNQSKSKSVQWWYGLWMISLLISWAGSNHGESPGPLFSGSNVFYKSTANCELKADEIDVKIRLWTHNHQHHPNPPLTTRTTLNHPIHPNQHHLASRYLMVRNSVIRPLQALTTLVTIHRGVLVRFDRLMARWW